MRTVHNSAAMVYEKKVWNTLTNKSGIVISVLKFKKLLKIYFCDEWNVTYIVCVYCNLCCGFIFVFHISILIFIEFRLLTQAKQGQPVYILPINKDWKKRNKQNKMHLPGYGIIFCRPVHFYCQHSILQCHH